MKITIPYPHKNAVAARVPSAALDSPTPFKQHSTPMAKSMATTTTVATATNNSKEVADSAQSLALKLAGKNCSEMLNLANYFDIRWFFVTYLHFL